MDPVKKVVTVTQEMGREIRKHYKQQGLTDVDLIQSDEGALVPLPAKKHFGVSWRRWKLGRGFIATCSQCNARGEFQDVTAAGKKLLRFQHCGRADKLPLLLRWIY